MKIKVMTDDLIKELEEGLVGYEKEYKNVVVLYKQKSKEYLGYLDKYIEVLATDDQPAQLKYPPSTPAWLRNNYVDTLEALKAHKEATIVMDDREYIDAREGVKRLKREINETVTSLNAISY